MVFEPMDDYVDFNSDLFSNGAKMINEYHTVNGKHYLGCVSSTVGNIMIYNKDTMERYGLDDPAELAYNNEWTWEALKKMCIEFCDPEDDRYAIDGWYSEASFILSTGVPQIGMKDDKVVTIL